MKDTIKVLGSLNRAHSAKVSLLIIALVAVIGFLMVGCDALFGTKKDPGDPNGDGTGTGDGDPRKNAKLVEVGYTNTHTIASTGEHWFKFEGTGDPIIFETTGDVVDTNIAVWDNYDSIGGWWTTAWDYDSGDGVNALCSLTTTSGKTYWIKITANNSTKGAYTFVVKEPTSNLRANPITVSVGNSSSHTIFRDGTHWFRFTGTGDRVFFETEGNVVDTNLRIYIENDTNYAYSKGNDKGINFFTVSGTTYYINITGNSGTYTFIVRNGTGNGNSPYNAREVSIGHSSSYTITSSGEHWFTFNGTGNSVTFKTTGNIVDTNIAVWDSYDGIGGWWTTAWDYDSGDGVNALCTLTTISGKTYWIKITTANSTSGTYTFVVE